MQGEGLRLGLLLGHAGLNQLVCICERIELEGHGHITSLI
jgi:hypothetical protein